MNELKGTKLVEIPYMASQLIDPSKSVLIVGERGGGEGVSETVKFLGFSDVVTTDIVDVVEGSWLDTYAREWRHVTGDFCRYDVTEKFDYVISISVFEHFGFWFIGQHTADGVIDDGCRWDHDFRGILVACSLLRDENSRLIITLPAGPFMNYESNGRPWLRGYDWRRQHLIKEELEKNGYCIDNEKFFYSQDFSTWHEVGNEINHPKNYNLYCVETPNVIWGLTIKKK